MMKKIMVFGYGIVCYVIFFLTFLYAIGFVGNILVPKSIDAVPTDSLAVALIVNFLLLGVFAIQHSLMARPAFKRWWTQYVPKQVERSTYVLFSSLALILLFWQWRPIGGVIWDVQNPTTQLILMGLCASGWLLVLVSTFLINHFDLFGLRQVWLYLHGKPYTPVKFVMPGPYRMVRHPLYLGFLFAFWATPTMTVAHLVFALATTAYILIAIQLEERDLIGEHGESYRTYRRQVPMIVPIPGRKAKSDHSATQVA